MLSIPVAGQTAGLCGGTPYYITQPGDSIESVSRCFNITPELLIKANNIKNGRLFPYSELLIVQWIPKPGELKKIWENPVTGMTERLPRLTYMTSIIPALSCGKL